MTHTMQLQPSPFEMVKSGAKTIELLIDLFIFDSFAALYGALPLLECGYTEATW